MLFRHVPIPRDYDAALHSVDEIRALLAARAREDAIALTGADRKTADRLVFVRWMVAKGRLNDHA